MPLFRAGLVLVFAVFSLCAATPPQLKIFQLDVEQADCALIVSPNTNTLVVDVGLGASSANRLKALMDSLGITRIDHLVTSHYHQDHFGGVPRLLGALNVTVVNAYDRGFKPAFLATADFTNIFHQYETNVGHRATALRPGDTIPLDPLMTVRCVASSGSVIGQIAAPTNDENDNSVALLIEFGAFRFFTAGDIERHTETNIAARDLVMDVDAAKSSHHCSHTSSCQELLDDLDPTVIVISNGDHGTFMHPRQIVLSRYATNTPPPRVFQTNKYLGGLPGGNVADDFIGDLATTGDAGTVLITAVPGAGNFFVRCNGILRSFAIKNRGTGGVVITKVLPRPPGLDSQHEEVTFINRGPLPVLMDGWTLLDASGRTWDLGSLETLDPGEPGTVRRDGMALSLNDDGDSLSLIAPGGAVVDSFSYASSQEGVEIETGH